MTASLVTIVGPPASGKTTLARRLAEALPATLLREDYRGNPFLYDSYMSVGDVDLPCQLYFLMLRSRQLARGAWPAEGIVVSDYDFCMDQVYARSRLDAADLAVYDRVRRQVLPIIQPTDLLIHLEVGVPELMRRIVQRGRRHEKAITADFLDTLRLTYAAMDFTAVTGSVLRVDGESSDFRTPAGCRGVVDEVRSRLGLAV